jgi:hypothetical protein
LTAGGLSCNLTGDRWTPSDQITSDQIPSNQITLDQITLDQTSFDQMTLDLMILNQIALDWTTLDQIALNHLAEKHLKLSAYYFWGKSGGAKDFLKYPNLRGGIAGFVSLCKSQNFLLWFKALHTYLFFETH